MTTNPNTVETGSKDSALAGWSLSYVCVKPGSRTEPSEWLCTLRTDRGGLDVPYTKGCGLRRWKAPIPFGCYSGAKALKARPGQRVAYFHGRMTVDEAEALDKGTEATPPALDEVLWSALMDAEGVRHGQAFEDWCGEYGSDTDSRKAEKAFNSCRDEWAGLVRLGADFDALCKFFEDF